MASFVDAREAFNGCRRYSATHLQPVFLPLRIFVSPIRGTKDVKRERERGRMWSLIILVGYVGWKLQPTNLLENNEARIVVEIQKGGNKSAYIYMCVYIRVGRWVGCVLFTFFIPFIGRKKGNYLHRNFYRRVYTYTSFLSLSFYSTIYLHRIFS